MAVEDEDIFHKQRRNLIIVSSLMLFYELGRVKVTEKAKISFTEIELHNPEIINIFLHILLIYFIWRYTVAFIREGGHSKAFKNFATRVESYMFVNAVDRGLKKFGDQYHQHDVRSFSNSGFYKKGAEYTFKHFGYPPQEPEIKKIDVKGIRLFAIKTLVFSIHFLTTNLFLEYYFPFFVAALAFLQSFDIGFASLVSNFFNW